MLFLNEMYVDRPRDRAARFRWVRVPSSAELTQPSHTIEPAQQRGVGACEARVTLSVAGYLRERGENLKAQNSSRVLSRQSCPGH